MLLAASLMVDALHSSSPTAPETVLVTDQDKAGEKQPEKSKYEVPMTKPVVTKHKVTVEGREISYTATAGQLPIMNDAGEAEAQMFFIAYAVNNNSAPANKRPLLFVFNGGPGASAVWLHLGAVGPRRVRMLADGNMPPPPYVLMDN